MTITTTYPGVYIQEIPSGVRPITGVATSITAFIGPAPRGPANKAVSIGSFADFERGFGGLARDSGLGYAVRQFYLNGGGDALVVRVVHTGDDDATQNAAAATIDVGGLPLRALGPGTWADSLQVEVTAPDPMYAADIAAAQSVKPGDLFNLTIRESADPQAAQETYLNVTVVDGPRRVDHVLDSSTIVELAGDRPAAAPAAATHTVADADKGRDGATPTSADYLGTELAKTGVYALLDADLFNIVCFTPPGPASDVPPGVWAVAAEFCRDHRAFLLVDPPASKTKEDVVAWPTADDGAGLSGLPRRNAAIYFPRILMRDPLRADAVGDFAPSGAVAGIYAGTDASRGVWKAPAGLDDGGINGALGLSVTLTDKENGDLNPHGVNCLRTFRDSGSVVWGARTLMGADSLADEYKYVPVRRLALYLEESLYRGTQWVVFEPNDEPLWSQIRLNVGAFMQNLFRQGAFEGKSPRDAYFVKCDSDTTTPNDQNLGRVNILVGFAPLRPAEFVILQIQQIARAQA